MAKYNPFRPGSVVSPGMFCGRGDEIRRIEHGLFQTKNGNPYHFIIEGERGIGKSSLCLLLEIMSRGKAITGEKLNFLVVSIELRAGMEYEDIVNTLIQELGRQVATRERLMELCKIAWGFLSNFEVMGIKYNEKERQQQCNQLLDELTNALVNIIRESQAELDGVLILIDEADKPEAAANLGEMCKLLTERLTRRNCERVSIGLSGLPGIIAKLKESHESSPRVFSVLALAPLEDNECKAVIHRGLDEAAKKNGFPTEISDEAAELIASLSEGYPHFLQEFCYCAFDKDTDNVIDRQDVIDGAFSENGALDQLGKKYFAELYIDQIGSEDYRKALIAMADSFDGWVSRQDIMKRSGVKERTIDNALRALKEKNIIVANERVRGEYRLPTKSFAVWIRARETARSTLTEYGPMLPLPRATQKRT